MATVEKIRKDIEKTKEKISAQQKRLRELEAQLTEEENLEIVRLVKAVRMDNKELTAFLKAYARAVSIPANRVSGRWCCPVRTIFPAVPKSAGIRVQNGRRNSLWRIFCVEAV